MSKGHFAGPIGIGAAVVVAAGIAWVGCNQWEGVTLEQSSLTTLYNSITQAGNESRAGWYDNQPGLDPAIVGSANFKKVFDIALPLSGGQVLAQPLVWNNKVLVVTEANNVFLFDAASNTGLPALAQRSLGETPFDATTIGCGDISPTVGITGAPVIDNATSTAYFFSKNSTPTIRLHAIDLNSSSLAEKTGFPVTISGTAQNNTGITFQPLVQHQRPGLLLMNGVVYGAFGSHCDINSGGFNYNGWIIGVTTAGQIVTRWATMSGTASTSHASGIWMSGGGIMSDQSGDIVFSTGNGPNTNGQAYPAPIAGTSPPADLEEAVVRLRLQADKTFKTVDFFSPFNAGMLNGGDSDLGSGGVISLPSQFGAGSTTPNLAAVAGKGGTLYLLNRSALGGYQQGASGGDQVLSALSLGGGTWSRPSAWPGDGGYVYVTVNGTGNNLQVFQAGKNAQNAAILTKVATAPENFGAFSGSPVVTSNGLTSGSAVVWVTRGVAELRAYRAVPVGGTLQNITLVNGGGFGNNAKFTTPGVGNGRIFLGTGAGHLVCFGTASAPPITGGPLDFGKVTVNLTKSLSVTLTANANITIESVSSSNNAVFTPGTASPLNLLAGQTAQLPVTFKPTATGVITATLTVVTNQGNGFVTVTGEGQSAGATLVASPTQVNFGGVVTGQTKTLAVTLTNTGSTTLTFATTTAPTAPYSATGIPANGATLAAGAQLTVNVTFAPTSAGTANQTLTFNSNGGNVPVALVGTSGTAPTMVITPTPPTPIEFGTVAAGSSVSKSFTIQNTGDLALGITLSKAPVLGQFSATTSLPEGSSIAGHTTITETVKFAPTTSGSLTDVWEITGSDTSGKQSVTFHGTGTGSLNVLPRTGWVASASVTGGADVPANAIDASTTTRWSTGTAMVPGMWFQVDMTTANTVSQIVMSSNGDYARGYEVYVTNDPANLGTAVATGTATASPITVPFAAKSGRYIRVIQTTTTTPTWWSIYDFNAYGSGGGGGGGGAIQINAGGPAVAPYVADVDFAGGGTISHANTIDVSGVTNPAPAAVYQTARTGTFTYTIPGFTANSSHTVRLHMCETFFNTVGSRTFNVTLNGTQVLTNFDIRATAGAQNKAIVQQFTTNANASGQYVITFTTVVNSALISGIEIN